MLSGFGIMLWAYMVARLAEIASRKGDQSPNLSVKIILYLMVLVVSVGLAMIISFEESVADLFGSLASGFPSK